MTARPLSSFRCSTVSPWETTTRVVPLTVIGQFVWVVAVGLLVGAAIGWVVLWFIRALSIWWLMPVLRRIGVGITREKATVLVWGGLRGAVSLSLALSMAQNERIPGLLRNEILFLTAGIVVLTIVINGSTMEGLLHLLKLDRLPKAKEDSVHRACQAIKVQMDEFTKSIMHDPFFKTVDPESLTKVINDADEGPEQVSRAVGQEELDIAFMRRLLVIERSDYWRQFEEGYVGRQAVFVLSRSVEHALDKTAGDLSAAIPAIDLYGAHPSRVDEPFAGDGPIHGGVAL